VPVKEIIGIASDHAGTDLKSKIIETFSDYEWIDLGPQDSDRVDYPDFAEKLSSRISSGGLSRGILICGTGVGMSIAANKFKGVRAALISDPETAKLTREHNDSNILCLGARNISEKLNLEIVDFWTSTPFSNDERHLKRIEKIHAIERRNLK